MEKSVPLSKYWSKLLDTKFISRVLQLIIIERMKKPSRRHGSVHTDSPSKLEVVVSNLEYSEMGSSTETPVHRLSKFASQLPPFPMLSTSSVQMKRTQSHTGDGRHSPVATMQRSFSAAVSPNSYGCIGRTLKTNVAPESTNIPNVSHLMKTANSFAEFEPGFNRSGPLYRCEGLQQPRPQRTALPPPMPQFSTGGTLPPPPASVAPTLRQGWDVQLLQTQMETLAQEILKSEVIFMAAQDGYVSEETVRMQVDVLNRVMSMTVRLTDELRGPSK
jgi:hypothetical protein